MTGSEIETPGEASSVAEPPSLSYSDNAPQLRSGPLGVLTLLAVGLVVAFLYFARDVVVPIALAVLLSFLLFPAVRWLRRWHLGRVTAVALTVLIAFLVMIGFAAIVVQEISSLAQQLPEYRANLETKIRSLPAAVWRLDPAELTATVAAIARPNTVAVTSLREAIVSLQSDLSTDGEAAPAGPAIRATAIG
jgi:predicted PurR-regulated permease PerM